MKKAAIGTNDLGIIATAVIQKRPRIKPEVFLFTGKFSPLVPWYYGTIYLPNVRGEERCTLLPVTGDVDNPMLSRSLLFIMSLVLRGGIRIIDCRSSIRVLCITVGRDNMIVHFGC